MTYKNLASVCQNFNAKLLEEKVSRSSYFHNRKGIAQYYNIARKISIEYEYDLSKLCFGSLTLKPGQKIKLLLS